MTGVWVWIGHAGFGERIQFALEHFGDRITDISIFGWNVGIDGELTQTFNPSQLDDTRTQWPHIRFWLCFRNMDDPDHSARTIFDALRDDATARETLASECADLLGTYSWAHGIDIDLESGGNGDSEDSEAIFEAVANATHAAGGEVSAALPPMTSAGSIGGENWARYSQLGALMDHVAIMSYDFAWAGSAPGPVSPGYWMEDVYDWAASQISPEKVSMGLPCYGYFWSIHDYPENLSGRVYRGLSGTYYLAWQMFTGYMAWGTGHHHIGWICYRDEDSWTPWGFLNVYDWMDGTDYATASGVIGSSFQRRNYVTRFGAASGAPRWTVADNSAGDSHVDYQVTAEPVLDVDGNSVGPHEGYTITVELLRRAPVAATIIDDYATSSQQLSDVYTGGDWEHVDHSGYTQYQGYGDLHFDHSFDDGETPLDPEDGQWPEAYLTVVEEHNEWTWQAWSDWMELQGYDGDDRDTEMQKWLADLGYYEGLIDGDFGSMSVEALQEFLADEGHYGGLIDGDRGPMTVEAECNYLNAVAESIVGRRALYVQARFQHATSGRIGVTAGGWTADLADTGEVRLLRDGTVVDSTWMQARPVGWAPGEGRSVIGLRVREGSARVYAGTSETSMPLRIHAQGSIGSGPAGITAQAEAWVDRIYCGDGWWYQPREAVSVQLNGAQATLGRVPRTGVTWDTANRFRPDTDVDEHETREDGYSQDWVYEHWYDVPIRTGQTSTVRVIPTDHDAWFGRLILCDRDGASMVHFSDAESLAHWRSRAANDWELQGIALWALGQEDLRLWDTLAAGHLDGETKRLNA